MADISDVEEAFVDSIASALYPGGTSQASFIGTLCRVYRGWPNSSTLNQDLASGSVNVTVLADNESGRNTTRYLPEWRTTARIPGTTICATDQIITIGGTPAVGDVVGVLIDHNTYTYRVQTGDTAVQVAAGLYQAIQSNRIVTLNYKTILVYDTPTIITRVVTDANATMESRRQEKDLRVSCWCSSPTIRDTVATALDRYLAEQSFLSLPDGTEVRVVYKNTNSYDQAQNALLYRRDLVYTVEYCTVNTSLQSSMLFGDAVLNGVSNYG